MSLTPNQEGLESAQPDLQSVFKKPGRALAEPPLWEIASPPESRPQAHLA